MVHPHYGILVSNVKELTADPHSDVGESQMPYVKRNKPDSKDYRPYHSIFITF